MTSKTGSLKAAIQNPRVPRVPRGSKRGICENLGNLRLHWKAVGFFQNDVKGNVKNPKPIATVNLSGGHC